MSKYPQASIKPLRTYSKLLPQDFFTAFWNIEPLLSSLRGEKEKYLGFRFKNIHIFYIFLPPRVNPGVKSQKIFQKFTPRVNPGVKKHKNFKNIYPGVYPGGNFFKIFCDEFTPGFTRGVYQNNKNSALWKTLQ